MSTLSPPGKMQPDWLSMWFGWPFLFYREWLKVFRAESLPATPIGIEEFGMTESNHELVLVAEAPEFKGNELGATIQENVLNIKGERHEQLEDGELHVSYDRKVTLPPSVNVKEAKTHLSDGIVEVHIPKLSGIEAPGESDGAQGRANAKAKPARKPKAAKRKSSRAPRATAAAKRGKSKKTASKKTQKR